MSDIEFLPYYSVNPRGITVFEMPDRRIFSEKQKNTMLENISDNSNLFNELSEMARKRLQKAVDYMLYMTDEKNIIGKKQTRKDINTPEITIEKGNDFKKTVKYKITFVTLTLSAKQTHTDEEIKNGLLNQFLTEIKKMFAVDLYIWKAEKQENGNIHFHILTNMFIHHSELRKLWNRIQNKFGYVDRYSENMKNFFKNGFRSFPNDKRTIETQIHAYEENKKTGWTNPNSTDIHALYKIKNISAYMTKYLTKDVTKTSRVFTLQKLYKEKDRLNEAITKIDNEIVFVNTESIHFKSMFEQNKKQLEALELVTKEIQDELKKGVSGRIWGQSQKLSKVSNFVEMESFFNIPDIDKVQKLARMIEKEVGPERFVRSYYFDIERTPKLKRKLDAHLNKTLRGEQTIDFDFETSESDFYGKK